MKERLLNTMLNKKVFYNISKLYSLQGGVRVKEKLSDVSIIENAFIYVENEIIKEIGKMDNNFVFNEDIQYIDLKGKIVTPGFIDAHTHLVFLGNRNEEYLERMGGQTYLEGLKKGKGIYKTVEDTKNASIEELVKKAKENALYLISKGVTTIESKSGYGLDLDTEIKQLRVNNEVASLLNIDIVSTYLGAHAVPKNMSKEDYIDFMINVVMPFIKKEGLAEFIDVFTERNVFSIEDTIKIFDKAKELGFKLKIHADEMTPLGGAGLAAKYKCISADHLLCAKEEDLINMKENNVVAMLLPMTSFNLKKNYANISFMKENGLIIALSTDFNPGSSPCNDFIMMMRVASRVYNLTPSEILSMVTINAAKALDKDWIMGSLEKNKQADFVVFDEESFDDVIISMGNPYLKEVYKKGQLIWRDNNEWTR